MDTTHIFVCCFEFLQPFGNHISFSHPIQVLLPELWKFGCEWDKAFSGDNGKAIKDWLHGTQLLGTAGISRLVGTMEFHVFCDASLEATASVAYIKTTR